MEADEFERLKDLMSQHHLHRDLESVPINCLKYSKPDVTVVKCNVGEAFEVSYVPRHGETCTHSCPGLDALAEYLRHLNI